MYSKNKNKIYSKILEDKFKGQERTMKPLDV